VHELKSCSNYLWRTDCTECSARLSACDRTPRGSSDIGLKVAESLETIRLKGYLLKLLRLSKELKILM